MRQAERLSAAPIFSTHGHFQSCSFKHIKVSATLTDCFSENQISSTLVPRCMLSGAVDERSPSVPALRPLKLHPSRTGTGFENPRASKAQALFEDLARHYLWVKDLLGLAKNNREGRKATVVWFVLFLLCFFFFWTWEISINLLFSERLDGSSFPQWSWPLSGHRPHQIQVAS